MSNRGGTYGNYCKYKMNLEKDFQPTTSSAGSGSSDAYNYYSFEIIILSLGMPSILKFKDYKQSLS